MIQIYGGNGKAEKFFCLFLMLVGVMVLIFGAIISVQEISLMRRSQETTAVITYIEMRRRGNDYSGIAFVEYEVDGIIYNRQLNSWNSRMRVGQHITILYDPADPTQITTQGSVIAIPVIMSIMGIMGIVVPALVLKQMNEQRMSRISYSPYGRDKRW